MLGSGGFGDVVLARHDTSGRQVAIKYLHRQLLADAEFAELFRAEAAVLAFLDDQPDLSPAAITWPAAVDAGLVTR